MLHHHLTLAARYILRTMQELIYSCYKLHYIIIVVLHDLSWKPNRQKKDSKQKTLLLFMCVVVAALLETAQSIIASFIFYRLLQSGDVEQNPGPGTLIIHND